MGWFDDVKGGLKKGLKTAGNAGDKVSDALIDKKAWKHTAQAMLDGPGGKEVRMADLANMALDSTTLVPGVGLVGGAARVGARAAVKRGGKEAAEKAEQKLVANALRSETNQKVRAKTGEAVAKLTAKAPSKGGRELVEKATGPLAKQAGRIASKQKAGVGTKVGFGQTKKRVLKTGAVTAGANAAARVWDEGLAGLLGDKGNGGEGYGPGEGGPGAGGAGGFMLVGANGESVPLPADLQKLLAGFMNQGGSPAGSQVVHLGN